MLSVNDKLSTKDSIGLGRKGTINKPQFLKAPFWTVDTLFFLTPFNNYDIQYIYAIIQKINWLKMNEASGVPSLSKTTIEETYQYFPIYGEQEKIGKLLKLINAEVLLQKQQLSLYRRIKDVFLQQMFASDGDLLPKMRFADFHGNWEQHKIGDIAETYSGGTPSITDKIYYDGSIPFIRSAEIGSSKVELHISDSGLINSSARLVDSGDILYALYGATSGTVGISKISGAINQAILAIIPYENYDKEFICQWLNYNKEKIVGKYLQGGQGNLSGTIVKNLICTFPSYIEQNKIGIFLKKMDREIEKQVHIIENLKNQKDYYLQNLFC